jgi:hypothetical protein
MRRALRTIVFALALAAISSLTFAQDKPETSHLAFVSEYIHQLGATEDLRESGERELKQDPKASFSTMIHTGTLFQLELKSQIAMLKSMRLNAPYDDLIPTITGFYEDKIALWQKIIDSSTAFVAGPKPDVDYDKLAAEVPQVRAQLEFIDESLFKATPLIFATLINEKPDSKNHASHLIITKVERAKLIHDLKIEFGTKLDQKNPNYTVSSARVLKGYLLKDFKCSDDPWD